MSGNDPFEPEAGQEIVLFGEAFVFQGTRIGKIPMIDRIDIGTRGSIYRLRDRNGRDHALKVFRPGFQEASLEHVGRRLAPVQGLDGLLAAERRMILPGDPAALLHPRLQYAMLMRWIEGQTWSSLLNTAGAGSLLQPWAAIHLCARFLSVLAELERRGAAHTDIAGGNVVVDLSAPSVQLIDLEDLFLPGLPRGIQENQGSPGYCHPRGESPVCPEGDRYATAILAAEMLLLASPALAGQADEGGFFGDDHATPQAAERYRRAEEWLRSFAPDFLAVFRKAWRSASLAACPAITELARPVAGLAARTQRGASPALIRNRIQRTVPLSVPAVPAAPAPAPAAPSRRIRWEPIPLPPPPAPPRPAPPPPPIPPPLPVRLPLPAPPVRRGIPAGLLWLGLALLFLIFWFLSQL